MLFDLFGQAGDELFSSSCEWLQPTGEINICGIKDTVNYIGVYKFPLLLSLENLILYQRVSPKDCMYF